jgi:hypothetical protein
MHTPLYLREQLELDMPVDLTSTEPFTSRDIFNVPVPFIVVKALLVVAVDLPLTAETKQRAPP